MKKLFLAIAVFFALMISITPARAITLDDLDKVIVLTPKSTIISLLGQPHHTGEFMKGLEADIYVIEGVTPLIGKGCIYGQNDILKGHALVFEGAMGRQTYERMLVNGFKLIKEQDGTYTMLGADDDTGIPIIVTIIEDENLTTVITFEKEFYEKEVPKK